MNFKRIFDLLDPSLPRPKMQGGILDFVSQDSPYRPIAKAYDKASEKYDEYFSGESFFLKILKKVALGLDKEPVEECNKIVKRMLERVKNGIILDVPAGTGIFTFEEYVKYPNILFVAVDYSSGMLGKAQERIRKMNAGNVVLIRADVGALPFKSDIFDAILCLNGIHSFPDKTRAVAEMSRTLRRSGAIYGSLVLKDERWITDFIIKHVYYRLLWFTKPALSREEFLGLLNKKGLNIGSYKLLKAAMAFEAGKA